MLYEINYLVLQSKTSDLEKIRAEMKKIVESFDAKVTAEREYLKRKLSYEISHERYGFFTVLRFEIKNNDQIQELKKNLNIDENVARYIIVKADELPSLEEHVKIELDIQRKDTLKQEEVEQALAKEAKKASETEPEKIETVTPTKEEIKKEEVEIKEEKIQEEVKKDAVEEKEVKEEKKKEIEIEEVEEIVEEKPLEEKEKEDDKKEKEDKVSLDELDKKLDEILNL